METKKAILTRLLPKTGQFGIERAKDDGSYQAGWWRTLGVADNRVRFIQKTVGGEDIAFDRATGLVWPIDGDDAGGNNATTLIWDNAIDWADGLEFGGFCDWRLPNIRELSSLLDYSKGSGLAISPFSLGVVRDYWTSTTYSYTPTEKWYVNFYTGVLAKGDLTTLKYVLAVRGGL